MVHLRCNQGIKCFLHLSQAVLGKVEDTQTHRCDIAGGYAFNERNRFQLEQTFRVELLRR